MAGVPWQVVGACCFGSWPLSLLWRVQIPPFPSKVLTFCLFHWHGGGVGRVSGISGLCMAASAMWG
jgi:hypothetical protein